MKDCIFCKIAKGEIPSEKIHESENFLVFKDANPETEGHSLVIPKEHYETLLDLPQSLYQELLTTTKESTEKLLQENSATGFNIVINNKKVAGQIIPHLHLHIIPRKEGSSLQVKL